MAGEELLHGGLFQVVLLGDDAVQSAQQPIHIAQNIRDSALFGFGWARHSDLLQWSDPEFQPSCPNGSGSQPTLSWLALKQLMPKLWDVRVGHREIRARAVSGRVEVGQRLPTH